MNLKLIISVVSFFVFFILFILILKNQNPSGLTPKDKCNNAGKVWDPETNSCKDISCKCTVDNKTGLVTGKVLDFDGTGCVTLTKNTYLSSITKANLLKLCQESLCEVPSEKCKGSTNFQAYAQDTQKCVMKAGCSSTPYAIDGNSSTAKLLDGCPNLTLVQNPENQAECIAPNNNQLQNLCQNSLSGCPYGSILSASCSQTGIGNACYSPGEGTCVSLSSQKGCRSDNTNTFWKWENGQCIDVSVSPSIKKVTLTADPTTFNIKGNFEINYSFGENLTYTYQMILQNPSKSDIPLSGYVHVTLASLPENAPTPNRNTVLKQTNVTAFNNFSITFPTNRKGPSTEKYNLILQAWVIQKSSGGKPILRYVSANPLLITVVPGTLPPGIQQLTPTPSRATAEAVVKSLGLNNVLQAAGNSFKQIPEGSTTWTNMSLPTYCTGETCTTDYLLVPCTSEYCNKSSNGFINHAMLVLAWEPPSTENISAAIKACNFKSTFTTNNPQVFFYALMEEHQPSGVTRKIPLFESGTSPRWFGPITANPNYSWDISIGTYLWPSISNQKPTWENATCKSPIVNIQVRIPPNFYTSNTCFKIKPLKPSGMPIPENYSVYDSTINGCRPVNTLQQIDVTAARDINCIWNISDTLLPDGTTPSIEVGALAMYTCDNGGQACGDSTDPHNPCGVVIKNNSPVPSTDNPPNILPSCSSNTNYKRKVYCGCSTRVENNLCGNESFCDVGSNGSGVVSQNNWETRLKQVNNFINSYGLLDGNSIFGLGKKDSMKMFQNAVNEGKLTDSWKNYQQCPVQDKSPLCWASSAESTCTSQCSKDEACISACQEQSFDCLSDNSTNPYSKSGEATFDCTQWNQDDPNNMYAYSQILKCYPPPFKDNTCPPSKNYRVKGECVATVPTQQTIKSGICSTLP